MIDLEAFARDGYVVVRDVVDSALCAAADAEIDGLGPARDGVVGVHHRFEPVARLPRCEVLLRESGALQGANALVAPHVLDHAFDHIQVATTIPPWTHVPGGPHIDGHGAGQSPPHSFTLLAGVALTDQMRAQSGNLWIWPGSHLEHARLFAERGTRWLEPLGGHAPITTPPVEVKLARGDLVLAHFLTGHNQGGNVRDWVRRTVYFRLAAPGHRDRWGQTFLDPWSEYAPVRDGHHLDRADG